MYVRGLARPGPDPAYIPLAAARLFHLPFATSCPAQRGKADVQFGLPADAASLRETGSVHRYTPRGPVSHRIVYIASCGAVSCLINTLADGAEGLHFSAI